MSVKTDRKKLAIPLILFFIIYIILLFIFTYIICLHLIVHKLYAQIKSLKK